MLIDARTLANGATLEADVCIAGAGAAGITMALDLRESGLSVLLIESGGMDRAEETQVLSEGRMIGIDTWNMRAQRIRAFGGTTGHWAGWCRPLTRTDFEARDYVNLSGWPLTYDDMVPWYRRACHTVQIGAFDWDAPARAAATGRPLLPVGPKIEHRYYQISPPTRFGRVYAAPLEQAEDIRVVTFANLRDIRLNQQRGRVESFECRTLRGPAFRVQAGRYVLALGGIENARVLLASRSQQREGVANGYDVVGRYFMEHPHYHNSIGLVRPSKVDLSFYARGEADLKRPDGTPVQMLGAIGLATEILRSEKLLNFSTTIQGTPGGGRGVAGGVGAGAGRAAGPGRGGGGGGGGGRGALPPPESKQLPRSAIQDLLMRGEGDAIQSSLTIRAEQSPFRDSRVTLSDELDPIGMPRAALEWRIAPEDDVQMRRAMVILANELAAAGVARAWFPGDSTRFVWLQQQGGHHMGTTRMGKDPKTSVVNADSRTHQVDNLYITGGSVFTTGGDSNPTLTVVALAHRLAATLKKGKGA
jgi:choline dehydrogenase-like flavoprotein